MASEDYFNSQEDEKHRQQDAVLDPASLLITREEGIKPWRLRRVCSSMPEDFSACSKTLQATLHKIQEQNSTSWRLLPCTVPSDAVDGCRLPFCAEIDNNLSSMSQVHMRGRTSAIGKKWMCLPKTM